jgi:hypothetical protein
MSEEVILLEVSESRRPERVPSHLSRLRKRLSGGRRAQREEFNSILEIAGILAKQDPKALPLLVRLIGRSVQARVMTHVLRQPDSSGFSCENDSMMFSSLIELTRDGRRLDELKREVHSPRKLDLGVDLVLPWPWNGGRVVNCLSGLRPGGDWGRWRQDPNHCIELWLPLGIGWVHGGNHSLTVGILEAKGKVKPEVTYDISAIYKHVTCDGLEYKRKHDGSVIGRVPDLEMAAVFEIGRLIHKHRVTF